MPDTEMILVAFNKIAELALALGVQSIQDLPGPWLYNVNENWTIAVNAHEKPAPAEPPGMMRAEIPPYTAAIWFNGWLAGLIDPVSGTIAAGELANEDAFIAALDAAIRRAQDAAPFI